MYDLAIYLARHTTHLPCQFRISLPCLDETRHRLAGREACRKWHSRNPAIVYCSECTYNRHVVYIIYVGWNTHGGTVRIINSILVR